MRNGRGGSQQEVCFLDCEQMVKPYSETVTSLIHDVPEEAGADTSGLPKFVCILHNHLSNLHGCDGKSEDHRRGTRV